MLKGKSISLSFENGKSKTEKNDKKGFILKGQRS